MLEIIERLRLLEKRLENVEVAEKLFYNRATGQVDISGSSVNYPGVRILGGHIYQLAVGGAASGAPNANNLYIYDESTGRIRAILDYNGGWCFGPNVATRNVSIDSSVSNNNYLSWNYSGIEKWVAGVEGGYSDRWILFDATTSRYRQTLTNSGLFDFNGGYFRVNESGENAPATSGQGLEVASIGGVGYVLSYNRATSGYRPMQLGADTVAIVGGQQRLGIGMTPTHQLQLSLNDAYKPGTSTWVVTSDTRVKRNVKRYTRGVDLIKRIEPVEFEYNGKNGTPDDGRRYVGLIAQDAQEYAPEWIQTTPGEIDGAPTDILELDPNDIPYALVNAMQELISRVEKLEAENVALTARVAALEARQ